MYVYVHPYTQRLEHPFVPYVLNLRSTTNTLLFPVTGCSSSPKRLVDNCRLWPSRLGHVGRSSQWSSFFPLKQWKLERFGDLVTCLKGGTTNSIYVFERGYFTSPMKEFKTERFLSSTSTWWFPTGSWATPTAMATVAPRHRGPIEVSPFHLDLAIVSPTGVVGVVGVVGCCLQGSGMDGNNG